MFGRKTRMLLRHYLEQGTSKSARARTLGVHRDTVHRSIRDGRSIGISMARPSSMGRDDRSRSSWRRTPRSSRRGSRHIRSCRPCGCSARFVPRGMRAAIPAEGVRAAGAADVVTPSAGALRDAGRPPGAGGLCRVPVPVAQALRAARRARVLATAVVSIRPAPGHAHAAHRSRGRVPGVRRRAAREFLRFAHHWGFTPRACRPYRAQTKGKVERPVRYLRENLVYGRTFLNDADLAQQCADWLVPVAKARRHATTQERPRERFDRDERAVLQPVPSRRYTSLVLDAPAVTRPRPRPPKSGITVEKRPLSAYARLAGGAA